jgi:hypothetical protein
MQLRTKQLDGIIFSQEVWPFMTAALEVCGNEDRPGLDNKYFSFSSIQRLLGYLAQSYLNDLIDTVASKHNVRIPSKMVLSRIRKTMTDIMDKYSFQTYMYPSDVRPGRFSNFARVSEYLRLYRTKKQRLTTVGYFSEGEYTLINHFNYKELDVIRVLQYIDDKFTANDVLTYEKYILTKRLNSILKTEKLDKILDILFGDEYNSEEKTFFNETINLLLSRLNLVNNNSLIRINAWAVDESNMIDGNQHESLLIETGGQ